MRHWTLLTSVLAPLAGCSLLYNPNDLPVPEQPIDAPIDEPPPIDADPTMLEVTRVAPVTLVEGQGDGSRRVTLVIHGRHIVKDNTTVTLALHEGEMVTPTFTVHNDELEVSADGELLAVPVTIPVDPQLDATESARLDITVTQMAGGQPISVTLTEVDGGGPVLTLQGLDELTGDTANLVTTAQPKRFSRIELTGDLTASPSPGTNEPLRVRVTSTISIGGMVRVAAIGQGGGVGGGRGGDGGGGALGEAGRPGGGPAGGQPSGGAARFEGNDQLTDLAPSDSKNRGSGGAGGDAELLQPGGRGGGGGGTVDLDAGGDVTVGGVDAKGGDGTAATNDGGPGSGGTVLVRSLTGSVTIGANGITVAGGQLPVVGAAGRARVDAANAIAGAGASYRGPSFDPGTPLIVREARPTLTVRGQGERSVSYFFTNEDGSEAKGPESELIPQNSTKGIKLGHDLFPGTNELCLLVDEADTDSDTRNCIQIVFLP